MGNDDYFWTVKKVRLYVDTGDSYETRPKRDGYNGDQYNLAHNKALKLAWEARKDQPPHYGGLQQATYADSNGLIRQKHIIAVDNEDYRVTVVITRHDLDDEEDEEDPLW
tara:strand:- start:1197 stop:1526 length:330 start_codon:yes stop_codon:yes gene_type:complete